MQCQQCHRENPEGAGFCVACGTRLATPAQPPVSARFCPRCGATADGEARFCEMCGATFPDVAAPTARVVESHGAPTSAANVAAPATAAARTKPWAILGGIAAGAVASAAAVGGAWMFLNKKPEEAPKSAAVAMPAPAQASAPVDVGTASPALPAPGFAATPTGAPPTATYGQSAPSAAMPKASVPTYPSGTTPPAYSSGSSPPPAYVAGSLPPPAYPDSAPPQDFAGVPPPPLSAAYGDEPPPPLALSSAPEFVVAPSDTGSEYVYMAAGLVGLYFLAGEWYRYHNGHWFHSYAYNGRWDRMDRSRVPRSLYGVPPEYARVVGPNHHRVQYSELGGNWRNWDRQRHWNNQTWYQQEQRQDVRMQRQRAAEEERRRLQAAAAPTGGRTAYGSSPSSGMPVIQSGQRPPFGASGMPGQTGQPPGMRPQIGQDVTQSASGMTGAGSHRPQHGQGSMPAQSATPAGAVPPPGNHPSGGWSGQPGQSPSPGQPLPGVAPTQVYNAGGTSYGSGRNPSGASVPPTDTGGRQYESYRRSSGYEGGGNPGNRNALPSTGMSGGGVPTPVPTPSPPIGNRNPVVDNIGSGSRPHYGSGGLPGGQPALPTPVSPQNATPSPASHPGGHSGFGGQAASPGGSFGRSGGGEPPAVRQMPTPSAPPPAPPAQAMKPVAPPAPPPAAVKAPAPPPGKDRERDPKTGLPR